MIPMYVAANVTTAGVAFLSDDAAGIRWGHTKSVRTSRRDVAWEAF